jgi:hypothetical protein
VRENVVVGDGVKVMETRANLKIASSSTRCRRRISITWAIPILGYRAHLGAGVILSNVKLDHREIAVPTPEEYCNRSHEEFGAIVG